MVSWCLFLLILIFSQQSRGLSFTEHLEICAGQVYILNCGSIFENNVVNVNWTREQTQDWDTGIKIINQSLWFFPVQESHRGKYTCYYFSDMDESPENHFSISTATTFLNVSKSKCPEATSGPPLFLTKNRHGFLRCDSKSISEIANSNSFSILGWTWMKDCSPLSLAETSDKLTFGPVSLDDEGVYTCLLNFTFNGTSYTMAQSKKVIVRDSSPVPQKPRVIKPQKETLAVKLGSKLVLNCKVFVGHGSCEMDRAEFHNLYWLWNNSFMEDLPQHITTNNCTTEDNVEYLYSNLTIMEVQQEFFNIPYYCVILTSDGYDNGTVTLIQYSQRELYCTMAVLVAYAAVALGFVLFYMFKVDLVLAYRNLSPCLKQQNDGKLYDAYVSYLSEDCQSVSSATDFALKVLPDVLENQLGYSLFISCRDAPPGTAIHDVISETVGKSRRIIIVLPPQDLARPSKGELLNKMPNKHLSLNNNITAIDPDISELSGLNWGPYECWVGLHDALIKECMQVILVQVGAEVDDALLSESLRYVKNTQGILKWKQCYTKKPNGRFWKQMRYRMPPPQKARTAVMV
ncbi:interleukin-1 receptor type 1 [Silurus meridionalis]|uniref:Uncharacterized protein n=1 Tax=Silurus meridionalis TaxID=175797 RepID=A0A8T0BWF3_SILME|nr:interleukin-1 receptor type 1 [Silurus meridionalis]XP_046700452.1 interleukin-1 receptor type 1 [Silurus meridionalis]KAF7709817.1 hypothetical protein HF521_016667 [Silurus meridionalis]